MVLMALLVGISKAAMAVPILDQSQLSFSSGEFVQGNISVAQTFTPSVGGELASLDLFMSNHDTGEGKPLIVSIYNTQNGTPDSLLGTMDLNNIGGNYAWYSIDFSSLDMYLSANSLYAFVLSAPGTYLGIYPGGSVNDSYSGGMALIQNGVGATWQPDNRAKDLVFQTYMTVPDSTGPGILALSALSLIAFNRFQKRSNIAQSARDAGRR